MFPKPLELKPEQPLIVYELNEVPWRVIDWYVNRNPNSAIAALLKNANTSTTVTRDDGELHPWSTWPTLHRGVTNSVHNIRFINQNLAEAADYPPVWQTIKQTGKRVGLFGSLQSYPPPDEAGYEFYVPDTFAPGCETYPPRYEAFQSFNLRQTQQDGAQASAVQFDSSVASDVLKMLQSGLRLSTCMSLAVHLAKERINSLHRSRRSVLQALVAFDIFEDALNRSNPDFCTFFTNHVAGMMHRYWKHTFPEDFGSVLTTEADRFHSGSIGFAMAVADKQIAYLMKYVNARSGRLLVATSMGQEAIDRGEYQGEWRITNVGKFLKAINWLAPARDLMAMQPDFNFAFDSEADAENFMQSVSRLVDVNGVSVWKRMQKIANTVNLGLAPSSKALISGEAFLTTSNGLGRRMAIEDMGIQFLNRDPGTGYHQPKGALLLYGNGVVANDSRVEIDSTEVRPMILSMMGIA